MMLFRTISISYSASLPGLRPANTPSSDTNVRLDAGNGSAPAQRLRLGRPAVQRWGGILCRRQDSADLHDRKVGREASRLPRCSCPCAMNLGVRPL